MKEYKGELKLVLMALLIFNIVFMGISVRNQKKHLNTQLRKVIIFMEMILPHDLHDKLSRGEEIDMEQVERIFRQLSLYAHSEKLKFCYTIVDTPQGMKYAFGGIPLEIIDRGEFAQYYLYKVSPQEDTIYDIKRRMIEEGGDEFSGIYRDEFGKYRALVSPYETQGGNTILIGAEYDYDQYKRWFMREMFTIFFINSLILLGTLLMVFSIYQKNKAVRAAIIKEGMTDHLTGLYTRKALDTIDERIKAVDPALWAFLYFDLDGLKVINDTRGHKEGDRYILGFARILKKVFRHEDLILRLGGDEFLVVGEVAESSNIEIIEERLRREAYRSNIEFSMGFILVESTEIDDIDRIIKESDKRMYEEKQKKKAGRK